MKTVEKETKTILHTSDDGSHTYSLTKILNGERNKHMILVSLYPTRTEQNLTSDDDTTKHLLTHLPELGFDSVSIINLFSKVVKGCRMSTKNIQVDKINLDFCRDAYILNKAFEDSTWVIAWGATGSTSKGIRDAKIQLLELWGKQFPKKKLYQLTAPGIDSEEVVAVHPLFLGIRASHAKWGLKEYDWRQCVNAMKEEEKKKGEKKASMRQKAVKEKNMPSNQ